MAKIAMVGYGSQGQGTGKNPDGYAYVVNDNVRTKDRLQVIATNWKSQKKFATTSMVLHTHGQETSKGKIIEQKVESKTGKSPTDAYTGKELGVSGSRMTSTLPDGKTKQSSYTEQTRAAALGIEKAKDPNVQFTKNAQDTFDSYSKQFMKKGE